MTYSRCTYTCTYTPARHNTAYLQSHHSLSMIKLTVYNGIKHVDMREHRTLPGVKFLFFNPKYMLLVMS